jgi:CHAD domain-containing protein
MPSTSATPATPIVQLRENAKRLEAALTVGLADPTPKAVHELRSSTRRVEAQIDLLGMVHGLPTWKGPAEKVLRRLKTLRRKAGSVRDCDVQDKLLKDEDRELTSAPEAPSDIGQARDKLRKRIAKSRQRCGRKLLAEIDRQLPKLARDTEKLLAALKEAKHTEFPAATLLAEIERRLEPVTVSRERGEDHLHELRKAAKRARYQCESIPGPQAAAMARRFESLQDAGGSWHDLLDLATTCHRKFGAEHPLSRVIEHRRDEHLDSYLANLEDFRSRTRDHASAQRARTSAAKRKPPRKAAGPPSAQQRRKRA